MRGKVNCDKFERRQCRITPAYAGKRVFCLTKEQVYKDHPRLCGEKFIFRNTVLCSLGSPPPMRGKGFAAGVLMPTCGITPAYAGKSRALYAEAKNYEDHPRLCGEKGCWVLLRAVLRGSPPPMRGKVQNDRAKRTKARITPAYAGKSFRKTAVRHAIKDHPRLCGEKFSISPRRHFKTGSPPPMRGKGKCSGSAVADTQDHPRLCGEKDLIEKLEEVKGGSPPPMRGKVKNFSSISVFHWITPAYAGKSCFGSTAKNTG